MANHARNLIAMPLSVAIVTVKFKRVSQKHVLIAEIRASQILKIRADSSED